MNEEIDLSAIKNINDPAARAQIAEWEARTNEIKKRRERRKTLVSPPRTFQHISELLDTKRIEHSIVDAYFTYTQPLYDRVFVYQIEDFEENRMSTVGEKSLIVMPEDTEEYQKNISPRGIIIAAGIGARDYMRSHCFELGDTVQYQNLMPKRIRVGHVDGKAEYALSLYASDLVASEELNRKLRLGAVSVQWSQELGQHVYRDEITGEFHTPMARGNTSGDY